MVVPPKLLAVIAVGLALGTGACGGPSCIRNTDCPHGQRCLASSCQGPRAGSAAGSGSAAGASGNGTGAGSGAQAGAAGAVNDAGVASDASTVDGGP